MGQQHKGNYSATPPTPAELAPDAEDTFDAITPRIILNWHPNEQTTIYTSYAEGFRSGLHQNPVVRLAVPSIPLTQPDLLKNFEVGTKGTFLNGRIDYDTAVYHMDWQDVQLPLGIQVAGLGRVALVNGASASGLGVDFALNARPVKGLELGVNGSWNNLELDKDVVTFVAGANRLLFQEAMRLNGSIETTVGVSASYTFPLGRGLEGTLNASANRRTAVVGRGLDAANMPLVNRADPILLSRAAFTVHSSNHWSATLFVDNLNNEQDAAYRDAAPFLGFTNVTYLRPRTVGLQLEFRP